MILWVAMAPVSTTSLEKSRCLQIRRDSPVHMVRNYSHCCLWKCFLHFSQDIYSLYPFLFLSDKKCTYGIKCKFFHPERSHQSYLSLADELREKAQISTVKEDRNAILSARHLQSDPGSTHASPRLPDCSTELIRNQQNMSYSGQVCENQLLYWDDPRISQNHLICPITERQPHKNWSAPHSMSSHYYSNTSHDYLDSGLGSFESQYSDNPHSLSNPHRLRPQHHGVLTGPRQVSAHLGENANSQACTCSSHLVPSAALQQPHRNMDSKGQPLYAPHMFLPGVPQHHGIPSHLHYSEAPNHQQKYWSDPFQGLPQARAPCSLPSSIHSSHSHSSSSHQYHSWGHQPPPAAAFDPQRLELRKKLQAIFNPHQVDAVMKMFPHLMDAEKLAAEILNMKAQRGIF